VTVAGAAAAIIGALLPWVTASAAFVGAISRNGIDGDGRLTAGLGLIAGIVALVSFRAPTGPERANLIAVGVIGVIITAVGVYDYVHVKNALDGLTAEQRRLIVATVGVGLYVTIAGGAAIVVGGIMGGQVRNAAKQ